MKYTIWLAFLSIALLSACSNSAETQPVVPSAPDVSMTGETSQTPTTPSSKAYTAAEVAIHKSSSSCWSIVNDKVYDFTSWIEKHPGGPEAIIKICGIDGTDILHKQHGMSKDSMISKYYVGDLTK